MMLRIGGSIRVIFDAMEPGGDESGSRVCGSPTVMVVETIGNASNDGLRQILDEHRFDENLNRISGIRHQRILSGDSSRANREGSFLEPRLDICPVTPG